MSFSNFFWDTYVYVRHFRSMRKFKRSIGDFPKLIEVVLSCDTPEQCDTAMNYMKLYVRNSGENDLNEQDIFGAVNMIILDRIVWYLQDTRYHSEHSFHMNGEKTITTWPDLNDYLNEYLSLRFSKTWTRGKHSVISIGE